jgi:hypothetical protein
MAENEQRKEVDAIALVLVGLAILVVALISWRLAGFYVRPGQLTVTDLYAVRTQIVLIAVTSLTAVIVLWYARLTSIMARAGQRQIQLAEKDYIERNKPIVFADRVADAYGGHEYVMRNVGGGFAVNVFFVPSDATPDTSGQWPVRALGSLSANSERRLPEELNRALCDSANIPVPHLLIAEGPYSRTTQWTPTLNYRSANYDPREGHVEHRVATVAHPSARFQNQLLADFLKQNAADLFTQLKRLG